MENVPDILDCGHAPDKGHPVTVAGKRVMGWRFVLDGERKICHACADERILDCGHKVSPHSPMTTGYGEDRDGRRHCYDCCAENERKVMRKTGKATLYLTRVADERAITKHELTDWPGKLRIPVYYIRKGRHNMARVRYDFDFKFEGQNWRGTQYGDNTQIAHCKRVK